MFKQHLVVSVNGVLHVQKLRRTKIVTTLGPATDRDNNLEKSYRGGCQRCTYELFSRSPEDHKMRADKVREIAAKLGRHVAILGDLQGPKSVYPPLKKAKFSSILG